MRYSVMIVEDEKKILSYMKNKLAGYAEFDVLGCYDDPEDALEAFEGLLPDVAFLDIQMPRMTGLALAERLLAIKPDVNIVFLTAFEQYALDAFRVEAIDYLLKPIRSDDIDRVLQRLQKKRPKPAKPSSEPFKPLIRCLGTFEVAGPNGEPVKWPTKKTEELFACLWMNRGHSLGKWALVELLWPDVPEDRGVHNLYTSIYRVKQVLQQLPGAFVIERSNTMYRLLGPERISDLEELRLLGAGQKEVEAYPERAEQLYLDYRAPLFGDRGYAWSVPADAAAERLLERLGDMLLEWCRKTGNDKLAERLRETMEARQQEAM